MEKDIKIKNNEEKKPLIIIDGHALAYRSYFGMKQGFEPTIDGKPAGMVYGFCRAMMNLMERYKSEDIIVSFDTPEPTHRHEKVENYKGTREKAPDDFYPQFLLVDSFLEAFNCEVLRCPGYESDDVIATICKTEKEKRKCVVLTGDHDLWQLIDDNVKIIPLHGNLSNNGEIDAAHVEQKYGIKPTQMAYYKALCGDSSDNYKGVPGVGPKGAAGVINRFESYEKMRKHVTENEIGTENKDEKVLCKILEHLAAADVCFEIAQLHYDAPCPWELKNVNYKNAESWFTKKSIPSLAKKIRKLENFFENQKEPIPSLFAF